MRYEGKSLTVEDNKIAINDSTLQQNLVADKLDDIDSSQILRNDQSGTLSGDLNVNGSISTTGYFSGKDKIILNGDDVINYNDDNNETLNGYYENIDSVSIHGDNDINHVVIKTGHIKAEKTIHAQNKVGVGKVSMEYNSTADSFDIVFN